MNNKSKYKILANCCRQIRNVTDFIPEIAIVLGSGLGVFADEIKKEAVVEYSSLQDFPVSTVSGHNGRFVFGYIENIPVVIMQGRVHYYEGYSMDEVVMPIRVMHMLGAKKLILTNAAGGINRNYSAGEFMIVKGHISSFVPSVLRGENINELGPRFPDMSEVYDKNMIDAALKTAKDIGIHVNTGVYVQTQGPNYETPEEINMFAALGADAVGMSTACEAIAAKHMGMKICAVSCISNMAAGISKKPLSHEEVKETADKASDNFKKLIYNLVVNIENI